MITVHDQNYNIKTKSTVIEFRGLSTDNKPEETYGGVAIGNGSVFIEMDTEDIFFYDAANNEWVGGEE